MNPVFVAIDTSDLAAAAALAWTVAPHVGGLKLGLQFFMANGPDGVRRLGETGLPIFLDVKLHDIPNTVAGALKSLAGLDLAVVNVHAGGGADMLAAARDACPATTRLIGVTVLTSLDDADLHGVGVADSAAAQVARLADLCRRAGLDGVVCSPHDVASLKAAWPDGYYVVPGIRSGGPADDQKRTMAPREALAAGASMLVIGRPITGAPDPGEAARVIAADLLPLPLAGAGDSRASRCAAR